MINLYVHIVMYKNYEMYNCGVFVVYFFNFSNVLKCNCLLYLCHFNSY